MDTRFSRESLYVTLGVIIVLTVVVIMSLHSATLYTTTKHKMVEEMRENSRLSAAALRKNLSSLISAYAVNEYATIVHNELERRDLLAVIVEDDNMGKILGKETYISGSIRDGSGNAVDYDPSDPLQRNLLDETYFSEKYDITSPSGAKLGSLRIYTSSESMERELDRIVAATLINTAAITVLLIVSLFITIRRFILKPVSDIATVIGRSDEDGIPLEPIPDSGSSEISSLAGKMNRMIDAIRESRLALKEQHEYLQAIINGVDDPIMVINPDYTVELMNDAVRRSMGGKPVSDPEHPKCYEVGHRHSEPCSGFDFPCPLRDVMASGNRRIVVHRHDVSGEERFIELSATPLFDREHNCIGIIEAGRDITDHLKVQEELREQKTALEYQASHDALTGLANRALFNTRLEQGVSKSKRERTKLALLFIDLDHFKEINDSLGHKVGDKVLETVTRRLSETTRKEDTLARLGGDEFTVLIEGLKDAQDASVLASKILKLLSEPITIEGNVLYVGCSIGISLYPDNSELPQDLLKYADAAMYKAKNEGRNNFQYYSTEMTEKALERVTMETLLRTALKNGEFVVFFQPQVDGRSDQIRGLEALVRWNSPEMGMVSPARFIPIAESTGLIVELDRFVMKSAMTQLARWHEQGLNPGILSMNLAVKQLQQKDFIGKLKEMIEETGCRPEWLELEVTEGQIMLNPEEAIRVMEQISDLGIGLAIDDFGTGYSSLSYLKRLPIHKLKIDQSFVRELPHNDEDIAITKTIIALARNLNLHVIAEGVETRDQKEFLVSNGCDHIQGYFYARPMPGDEMESMLAKGL